MFLEHYLLLTRKKHQEDCFHVRLLTLKLHSKQLNS